MLNVLLCYNNIRCGNSSNQMLKAKMLRRISWSPQPKFKVVQSHMLGLVSFQIRSIKMNGCNWFDLMVAMHWRLKWINRFSIFSINSFKNLNNFNVFWGVCVRWPKRMVFTSGICRHSHRHWKSNETGCLLSSWSFFFSIFLCNHISTHLVCAFDHFACAGSF